MTDLSVSTYKSLAWLIPFSYPFLRCLAAFNSRHLGVCFPPTSDSFCLNLTQSPNSSSPSWSFFRPHSSSRSLAPSLPPTSVAFRNPNIGPIAFSLASSSASLFLSLHPWQLIPSIQRALISFRLSFFHRRHLVYRCSTVCSVPLHY